MQPIYAKKYFIYARKSTDSEDKQIASLEDQVHELNKLAERLGLNVVEVIEESQSAKEPGRPLFNSMMKRLKKGEADGVLSWKLNRLARNSIDGGQIIWHLQNGFVKHIQTYSSSYSPPDNVLMMYIEFGMANQYVNDLSVDTSRGMRRKAQRGWYPSGVLPIGYMHNKAVVDKYGMMKMKNSEAEIIPHPQRYSIVKTLWQYLLTGHYSVTDLKRKGDAMGLVNKDSKPYSLNSYSNLFKKDFYYGKYWWKTENGGHMAYKGKHKPMITELEFLKAQDILGNRPNHCGRTQKYCFAFRGLIRCGECQGHVSADHKYQVICTGCKVKFSAKHKVACPKCYLAIDQMKDKSVVDKIYYRCTKNYGPCSQPSITSKSIEETVKTKLKEYTIDEEFYLFMLKVLERFNEEFNDDGTSTQKLRKKQSDLNNRLENLSLMRADGELSFELYRTLSATAEGELKIIRKALLELEEGSTRWHKLMKDHLIFLKDADKRYAKIKGEEAKKKFMENFASNLVLKDKKLCFTGVYGVDAIQSCLIAYTTKNDRFEPKKPLIKYSDSRSFEVDYLNLLPTLRHVRTLPYL